MVKAKVIRQVFDYSGACLAQCYYTDYVWKSRSAKLHRIIFFQRASSIIDRIFGRNRTKYESFPFVTQLSYKLKLRMKASTWAKKHG